MQLASATRLGPFEILAPIGAGGMGEVYRARDTRLDRSVAIKVLSPELAASSGVRERFEREARAVSQLSHPHICALFDVGVHEGMDYLVMEYLEGETLAERLSRGPLPLQEVLEYGTQIADALDKAHRQGIVHRDLKPGNVMLTRTGAKLLDFGLARFALKEEQPLSGLTSLATAHKNLTQEGTILGTFQYMAPEQLEGLQADSRTDIFAFGALLYEMTTARKAFEGKTKTSLIAAIVDRDPPAISSVQPLTPPALEYLIRKCLEKDPERRWQSAADIATQLRWIAGRGSETEPSATGIARRTRTEWVAWTLAGLALLSAGALAVMWKRAADAPRPRLELMLAPPPNHELSVGGVGESIALSPDGTLLVFQARGKDGRSRLWVRPLRTSTAQPLNGTDNGLSPFWSPDSRHVGFFSQGKMRRVDISGGPAQVICDANGAGGYRGGTWNRDNVIVFTPNARSPLYRVSASGGTPQVLTQFNQAAGDYSHRYPWFLPDGDHYLYLSRSGSNSGSIMVGSLGKKDSKRLLSADSVAFYSEPGYVLFVRDRTLLAQKFDAGTHELGGDPIPIAANIRFYDSAAMAVMTSARRGVIAYQEGLSSAENELVWVDRNGKVISAVSTPRDYRSLSISNDGKRLAVTVRDSQNGNEDLWVYDLARGTGTRLTFEPLIDDWPVWTRDDREIVFSSEQLNRSLRDLQIRKSNGEGTQKLLYRAESLKYPTSFSPDGKWLAFNSMDLTTANSMDVLVLSRPDGKIVPVAATGFLERNAVFSPDGRWIAYSSDETGRDEVYVQRWPPAGGEKWQVSVGGGVVPQWRGDGKELFYRVIAENKIAAVPVDITGATFEAGQPQALFQSSLRTPGTWVAAPDGKRFLLNRPVREDVPLAVTVVANWEEGLE